MSKFVSETGNVGAENSTEKALIAIALILSYFIGKEQLVGLVFIYLAFNVLGYAYSGKSRIFASVLPLVAIVIVSLFGLIENDLYAVVRDLFYFVQAPLVFAAGYFAAVKIRRIDTIVGVFLFSAAVVALIHISHFALNPEILTETRYRIRTEVGTGHILLPIGISLIGFVYMQKAGFAKKNRLLYGIYLTLIATALVLSLSRGLWIFALVPLTIGFFALAQKPLKRIFLSLSVLVTLLAGGTLLSQLGIIDVQDGTFVEMGQELVVSSTEEMSIQDHLDFVDITHNWRGYESFQTLNAFLSGSPLQFLIGHGAGTLVDMGIYQRLGQGGEEMRFIPIIHNGYLYVMIKTGLIGLLLYLAFLFSPVLALRAFWASDEQARLVLLIRASCSLMILMSTFVITGMYNPGLFALVLLLGCTTGLLAIHSPSLGDEEGSR